MLTITTFSGNKTLIINKHRDLIKKKKKKSSIALPIDYY